VITVYIMSGIISHFTSVGLYATNESTNYKSLCSSKTSEMLGKCM